MTPLRVRPTSTSRVLPPAGSDPAGTAIPLAVNTCDKVVVSTPSRSWSAGRTVMTTCCCAWPPTVTSRTPDTDLSLGTTVFFSLLESTSGASGEDTDSSTMGTSSKLPAKTDGVTSVGSWVFAPSTADRMSATTLSVSVPNSHSTRTCDRPLALVEVTRVTPSTALTASSSGRLTSRSTASGAAPANTVTTLAEGASRDGMSSCLSPLVATSPTTRMMTVTRTTTVRLARLRRVRRVTAVA